MIKTEFKTSAEHSKKRWVRPMLICLVKAPEESVLMGCKLQDNCAVGPGTSRCHSFLRQSTCPSGSVKYCGGQYVYQPCSDCSGFNISSTEWLKCCGDQSHCLGGQTWGPYICCKCNDIRNS